MNLESLSSLPRVFANTFIDSIVNNSINRTDIKHVIINIVKTTLIIYGMSLISFLVSGAVLSNKIKITYPELKLPEDLETEDKKWIVWFNTTKRINQFVSLILLTSCFYYFGFYSFTTKKIRDFAIPLLLIVLPACLFQKKSDRFKTIRRAGQLFISGCLMSTPFKILLIIRCSLATVFATDAKGRKETITGILENHKILQSYQ